MKYDFSYSFIGDNNYQSRECNETVTIVQHDELSREYYEQSRKHEEQSQEHDEHSREYYLLEKCMTKTCFGSQLICTLNVWHKKITHFIDKS